MCAADHSVRAVWSLWTHPLLDVGIVQEGACSPARLRRSLPFFKSSSSHSCVCIQLLLVGIKKLNKLLHIHVVQWLVNLLLVDKKQSWLILIKCFMTTSVLTLQWGHITQLWRKITQTVPSLFITCVLSLRVKWSYSQNVFWTFCGHFPPRYQIKWERHCGRVCPFCCFLLTIRSLFCCFQHVVKKTAISTTSFLFQHIPYLEF